MLDRSEHLTTLMRVLKTLMDDALLNKILGFKGGTAAMLAYGLPRFSVDLDFDLLMPTDSQLLISLITKCISPFGTVEEAIEKKYTYFFLLRYQNGRHGLKIEISKRPATSRFLPMVINGIPIAIMKKEDMLAHKLAALRTRRRFATRDAFDSWYFLHENWEVNETIIQTLFHASLQTFFTDTIAFVEKIPEKNILHGLGELLTNAQKDWVRKNLKKDLLFEISLRLKK